MILPPVRVVRCAAKAHPCPHCGTPGRRKRRLRRRIRSLAYRQEAYLDVHYAEWRRRKWVVRFVLLALERWWRQVARASARSAHAASTGPEQQPPAASKAAG